MSLLPSSDDATAEQSGELRLLGVDEDGAGEVFEALSSETARRVLAAVHEEPAPPSELAARLDSSVQNVSYHLDSLAAADLVRVADTRYSEKGREMQVYAPAEDPLVVFVGTDERERSLRALLGRLLGGTALLAVASVLLHVLLSGDTPYLGFAATAGAGDGGPGAPVDPGVPAATAVFLGGLLVLVAATAWQYWGPEREAAVARVRASSTLSGTDWTRSRRVAGLAGALFLAALPTVVLVRALDLSVPWAGPAVVALLVALAAVQAYANSGLLVSWLVVFAPVAGFVAGVLGSALAADGVGAVVGVLGYAVVLGTLAALVLGTAGFALGLGARWLRARPAR